MSTFCRFTQAEFEEFLGVAPNGQPVNNSGWHRLNLGTLEAVYGKRVHPELTLRIYSTLEGGYARDNGSDAIRVVVFWRPPQKAREAFQAKGLIAADRWPLKVGGGTKVLRVQGWRDNLGKRLEAYREILPPTCRCGAPTVWRTPKKGAKWEPFWGCVWGRACPCGR